MYFDTRYVTMIQHKIRKNNEYGRSKKIKKLPSMRDKARRKFVSIIGVIMNPNTTGIRSKSSLFKTYPTNPKNAISKTSNISNLNENAPMQQEIIIKG
jgi:hypothetical protein